MKLTNLALMRTVPFYGSIHDFTVEAFIEKLEEVKLTGETDLFVKMSSGGGNPFAGWGVITAIRDWVTEVEGGTVKYRAEGVAASMAAFVTLFVSNSEAIEQTHFMVHRAAVPPWMENEETTALLKKVNGDLMKAFKAKVDVKKFKEFSKVPLTRFFDSNEPRIDVNLTAKQAKAIGLIDNVISLSPVEASELNTSLIAANMEPVEFTEVEAEEKYENQQKNNTKMTLEEFKAKYPNIFEEARDQGRGEGINEERDRVEAWMEFYEIDAEAVKTGIESGKGMNQKAVAHFNATAIKTNFINGAAGSGKPLRTKGDNPDDLGGGNGAPEDQDLGEFDAELKKRLGLEVESKTE